MTSIMKPMFRISTGSRLSKDDISHTASLSEELRAASKQAAEADCIKEVQDFYRKFGVRLSDEKVFRYACFYDFNAEDAIDAIREDNYNPYLTLKMKDLEGFFESDALFPVPHLRTRKNSEVMYMRPSRFHDVHKDCNQAVEGLCFVLNELSQTEEQCRTGVTLIANMKGVKKENFSKEHCRKMMNALQGEMVPSRVEAFLIVSPPSWFGRIMKWMKPAMSKDFAKKVHMINEERLSEFLMDDYEAYLPDELYRGLAQASEISEDYVDLKMMQEEDSQ